MEISAIGSAEIPLTFFLTTSAESAVSGDDYEGFTMMSVNVVVPTTTVNVRLVDDDTVEMPEQFQVSLLASDSLPSARVSISRNVTSVNIIDDDGKWSECNYIIIQLLTATFPCYIWEC